MTMTIQDYEKIQPNVTKYDISWNIPNSQCAWRVDGLMEKEPDTVAWIEEMGKDDVLYDIGANMGQYSLLAAKRGVLVHAFEPESQNFALLCRNIACNEFAQLLVTAWPIAASDKCGVNVFYAGVVMPGSSCHAFGDNRNFMGEYKQFKFRQGSFGTTLDFFANEHPKPTYVKIDVDGFEDKVIQGMKNLLKLPTLKSVLIETNTHLESHNKLSDVMQSAGFSFRTEEADKARRSEGPFKGIGNVIWRR